MKRILALPLIIGLATTVVLANSASYQLLDRTATAAISGKCFSTAPKSCGAAQYTYCSTTKCADQGYIFSDWQCPSNSMQLDWPGNNSIPLCRDLGDDGESVGCNETQTYYCATRTSCAVGSYSCAMANDGIYYCLGPLGTSTPAGPTNGATANNLACPTLTEVSGVGPMAQHLVIPGALQIIADANGLNFDPFR